MRKESNHTHVYARDIQAKDRSSLGVIAESIPPGAHVLDLGCGTGALGRYLGPWSGAVFDGLTISEAEATLARPHYRRVEIANLEQADLGKLFGTQTYDCVVCADVLEHLSNPDAVLRACHHLIKPEGQLLISVPNASYCGLIAELMQGEFKYRPEGLLDQTHLRFFTRQSLVRCVTQSGWAVSTLQPVVRDLHDSEFAPSIDRLPPAVARYLLSAPDALTYQHVLVARRNTADTSAVLSASGQVVDQAPPGAIRFTVQCYAADETGYSESRKWITSATIGVERQSVAIDIPPMPELHSLRIDPADREGYLHLYNLTVSDPHGNRLWGWDAAQDRAIALRQSRHEGVFLHDAPFASMTLALLYGDDPWIELPIPTHLLRTQGSQGVRVTATLGWPMSADYLALVGPMRALQLEASAGLHESEVALNQAKQTLLDADCKLHALQQQQEILLHDKQQLLQAKQQLESDLAGLAAHLQRIENSNVFRLTRPLVHAKMWLDRQLGLPGADRLTKSVSTMQLRSKQPHAMPKRMVDIIVPVYRGLEDTQRCLESVLSATCATPWRLIVINDASPDPEVTEWLRQWHKQMPPNGPVELLENPENLGFVATVNRGMACYPDHDVLLLNSDTEVANDWLDRITHAAYVFSRVGTVTPFSNNATIFSYPRFCSANELPDGHTTASLDQLFARQHRGQTLDVPTGVGFCMYIRRDCLNEVGLFDVDHFGKGYGEENDFCRRAAAAGWRNLHALDTFVRHAGGVSFGDSKSARERAAMETLRKLYPDYETLVHRFVQKDPARAYRQQVDLARLAAEDKPVVLAVLHDRGGGTQRHARELAAHLQPRVRFMALTPAGGGSVLLEMLDVSEAFQVAFQLPTQLNALLETLRRLGVSLIHFHHTIGHDAVVLKLPALLGIPYDFTAHDHYSYCPQISLTDHNNTYCGEKGLDQCRNCLRRSPAPGGVDIDTWRQRHSAFLAETRYVLAPSMDAAQRLARFVPVADVRLAPHTDVCVAQLPLAHSHRELKTTEPLRVVVIGAMSAIKGADVLEAAAIEAARQQVPVEFHLLGYAYRHLQTQPKARLTVHGPYQDADLPQLLAWLQPDLVWFPAQWPETYSYTLSACLQAGLPVAATDLGSFGERLSDRAWTWIQPWMRSGAEWLQFFDALRVGPFMGNTPPDTAPRSPLAGVPDGRRVKSWDYLKDYPPNRGSEVDLAAFTVEFLEMHRPERTAAAQSAETHLKRRLLTVVTRLRSAPGLRQVARRIPLRWQTHVKTWLNR